METEKTFIGNEKLEFRQIILKHIQNILNLSLRSNRDGERLILYFNSIEALGDVLIPFYDEQINSEFEQFENELIVIKKENSEQLKRLNPHDYSIKYENIHYAKKKRVYRNFFRKLNLLLERNDYLKSSVFGESKDEVVREGESEDE